jgi:hypothetical protein
MTIALQETDAPQVLRHLRGTLSLIGGWIFWDRDLDPVS